MRVAFIILALTVTGAARAQTPATPPAAGTTTHSTAHGTIAHAKAAKATKAAEYPAVHKSTTTKPKSNKTPVVAPHHGGEARKPVHPTAKIVTPKPAAKPIAPPPEKTPPKQTTKPVAPAKPPIPADEGPVSHLHLPRFVSLRSDEVNMRAGPAARFPILWQYKRKELPVKIEREFNIWRLVEDMDGVKGWVQQAMLNGRRTFVVVGTEPRTLRTEASDDSDAVAILKPGVVGRIRSCDAGAAWCRVQANDYIGWLPRSAFWGTDAGEPVVP